MNRKPPEPIDPIVSIKLGGVPPTRTLAWQKLIQEVLDMPDDGTWLQVHLRDPHDPRRASQSLKRWSNANRDQIDCNIEIRTVRQVLWVRKTFTPIPASRRAPRGSRKEKPSD